jgi:hypothetical protein
VGIVGAPCIIGGFNVSNLMGVTPRGVDIGGGVASCFCGVFGNVQSFFASAIGVCGGCCCGPGIIFLWGVIVGIGEARNVVLVSDSLIIIIIITET